MNPFRWLSRTATASSRAATADVFPHERTLGIAQDYAPTVYSDYFFISPAFYRAATLRANTLSRAPLVAGVITPDRQFEALPPANPLQHLLDTPNPDMTGKDLIIATEINLCIWGRAHISNEIRSGRRELWPLLPDRLAVVPGLADYIQGYIYRAATAKEVRYLPEEVTTLFYYNPQEPRTGTSPVAPLRLTMDMAHDALTHNRNLLRNSGVPQYIIAAPPGTTDPEIKAFLRRWKAKFQGPKKANEPAVFTGEQMERAAFSNTELEYHENLKWEVETAARVLGVPQPMLAAMREATLANVEALERILWRNTLVPEAEWIADHITHHLLPRIGYSHPYAVRFDLSKIDALLEEETPRLQREKAFLELGVHTINEIRQARGLTPLPGPEADDPDTVPARLARRIRFNIDQEDAGLQRPPGRNGARPSGDPAPSPARR